MRRAYKFRAYRRGPRRPRGAAAGRPLRPIQRRAGGTAPGWPMRASASPTACSGAAQGDTPGDPDGQGRHRSPHSSRPCAGWTPSSRHSSNASKPQAGKSLAILDSSLISGSAKCGSYNGDGARGPERRRGWARRTSRRTARQGAAITGRSPGRSRHSSSSAKHRRWYVIVIAETDPVPLPAAGRAVGVDLGVARFLTTSRRRDCRQPALPVRLSARDRGPATPQGSGQARVGEPAASSAAR